MEFCGLFFLFWFSWSSLFEGTYQLQSSQTQVLLQLRKHLEFPKELEILNQHGIDFCSISSSTQVNITCQENLLIELRILGDKPFKVSGFNGFAVPNQTLSESFSMDSFFTTIARLNSLKVLSLVSLGVWGPIPDKIHRLSSLEYLDLGSNFLFGSIPPTISRMEKLQTLIMDDNFLNDTVPSWFDSLSNLRILSLRNNRLKGPFPSSIGSVTTLTDLTVSNNEISGKLPDLGSLKNLNVLDLSRNRLSSTLPQMPKGLVMIILSNNSFSGEIPKQYGQLSGLQHLDLSSNTLRGIPPASLFTLHSINYLNLASNMLSGSLPDHLSCGSKLRLVDMHNNMLTGALPSCLRSEKRGVNFDWNCLSTDIKHQHEKSHCENVTLKRKQSRGKDLAILVGVILGILVLMLVLALGFVVLCRRYCPRGLSEQHLLHKSVQDSSAAGFSTELLSNASRLPSDKFFNLF